MSNKEKHILITGASGGIGKAIAVKLIKENYNVVLCYYKNAAFIEEINKLASEYNVSTRFLQFNINDRPNVKNILLEDIKNHNPYYGIICNAGITKDSSFPAMSGDDWDNVINTNLNSFYNILNPIMMPLIQSKKMKRIITISSVSGISGNRGQTNYSASKAALIGATKSLAIELGKRGITVNCIAPGVIDTDMVSSEVIDHVKPLIPLKRIGKSEEVAALANFLLSEDASYITKQVICIDGGMI